MPDRINTPTSVIAEVLGAQDKQEGTADGAIDVGTGVVTYKDGDGNWRVRQASANEDTARVAREARDPPMSLGSVGDSPLEDGYAADDHAFTVGGRSFDKFRVRLSTNASADPTDSLVGWDENGHASDDTINGTDPVDTFVARGIEVIERTDEDDLLLIEVL